MSDSTAIFGFWIKTYITHHSGQIIVTHYPPEPQPRRFRLGAWGHKGDQMRLVLKGWLVQIWNLYVFSLVWIIGLWTSSMKNVSGIPWFSTTFLRIHPPRVANQPSQHLNGRSILAYFDSVPSGQLLVVDQNELDKLDAQSSLNHLKGHLNWWLGAMTSAPSWICYLGKLTRIPPAFI
jgi:hypothetical protein